MRGCRGGGAILGQKRALLGQRTADLEPNAAIWGQFWGTLGATKLHLGAKRDKFRARPTLGGGTEMGGVVRVGFWGEKGVFWDL